MLISGEKKESWFQVMNSFYIQAAKNGILIVQNENGKYGKGRYQFLQPLDTSIEGFIDCVGLDPGT
jgi:hypothetical protein